MANRHETIRRERERGDKEEDGTVKCLERRKGNWRTERGRGKHEREFDLAGV
jgi:hypothetical protein